MGSRQMPWDCEICDGVVDWGDVGPSGGTDEKQDKPTCTCVKWAWDHRTGWEARRG